MKISQEDASAVRKQNNRAIDSIPYVGAIKEMVGNRILGVLGRPPRELFNFDDDVDEMLVGLYYVDLKRSFRPKAGGLSYDSYFYKWAPRKIVECLLGRKNPKTGKYRGGRYLGMLKALHPQYGYCGDMLKPYDIYGDLEGRDLGQEIDRIAKRMGMDEFVRLLYEGYMVKEAAVRMGMPRSTLKRRIKSLRKALEPVWREYMP